jgi:hypothetical protein
MKEFRQAKRILVLLGASMLGTFSCKDSFLNVAPTGQITESVLADAKGVDGLLIGAYASLNGRQNGGWFSGASNWLWGSIRGGDANKGTDAGDFSSMNPIVRFELDAANGEPNSKWLGSFEGVARTNITLKTLAAATSIPEADAKRLAGEARFLRGHFYFELKKSFNKVPWIDETMDDATAITVPNTEDIWSKIEADFKYAYENLPETQAQIGRANKWAAGAYLGKTLLYQKKWAEAKAVFDNVIANGRTSNNKKYGLVPNFVDVFRGSNENHEESVFAFQAAAGTGSVDNTNIELAMNYPYNTGPNGPGECCGFFAPSFELANSYRVTAGGLPLADKAYRLAANELKTDQGLLSNQAFTPDQGPIDPRLDYTIGRRGIQFLDWGPHPGADWIRDQRHAGPYTQKKYSYRKSDRGVYQDGSSWTPGYHAINFMIIRFADVLLMAAEAEIELGNLDKGREYINQVRRRAANPAAFVDPNVQYAVSEYPAFANKDAATQALRFERKLELALEGQRFFDLVRWEVADVEVNSYFQYEAVKLPVQLGGAQFTKGKHEYLPIPQVQMDFQRGVLVQNPGY